MKRIFCIVLSVLLLVILAVPVTAHSGRTDSSGGHYNSSTGEYHYHHGESAHQHRNGKCPYDSSGEILGLDYGTFFAGLVSFTIIFYLLISKLGIGFAICPDSKRDGFLPIFITLAISVFLSFIVTIILGDFIT